VVDEQPLQVLLPRHRLSGLVGKERVDFAHLKRRNR
jgi:hypothetical protein